jgi:hypothetical protein
LSEKPWLDISSRSELIGYNDKTTKKTGCAVYRPQLDVFSSLGTEEDFIHLLGFIKKSSAHYKMLLSDPRITKMIDYYWGPRKYWIFSNIVFVVTSSILIIWFLEIIFTFYVSFLIIEFPFVLVLILFELL